MEIHTRAQECLRDCRLSFDRAQEVQHPASYLIETQLDRLSSWASNINVLAANKASLDHRLHKAPEVARLVVSVLDMVKDRLQFCFSVLNNPCKFCAQKQLECDNKRTACGECLKINATCAYDDHGEWKDKQYTDEMTEAIDIISEEITILHRLSNTIRKATRDLRNTTIDSSFHLTNEQGENIEQEVNTMFAKLVAISIPCAGKHIGDRFVASMMTRRRRVSYRRTERNSRKTPQPTASSQTASVPKIQMEPLASNRSGDLLKPADEPSSQALLGPTSGPKVTNPPRMPNLKGSEVQTATILSPSRYLKASSSPSIASSNSRKTVAQDSLQTLPFPPRPRMYDRQRYNTLKPPIVAHHDAQIKELIANEQVYLTDGRFDKGLEIKQSIAAENKKYRDERQQLKRKCGQYQGSITCPICLRLYEKQTFKHDTKWRSHVLHDIQAYLCISDDCSTPLELYTRSNDWIAHMEGHEMAWHCDAHDDEPLKFKSEADYEKHMLKEHKGAFLESQLPYLIKSSAWADEPLYEKCPLCSTPDSSVSTIEHIIEHFRNIALKSLPDIDERLSLSTSDGTLSVRTGTSRETIREDRASLATPYFDEPVVVRPDDDLAYEEYPYSDWKGYDNFISSYPPGPKGLPRFEAGKQLKLFPFPLEAHPDSEDEYPQSWPADISVNFVRQSMPATNIRGYEWGYILRKLGSEPIENDSSVSMEDLADRIFYEIENHRLNFVRDAKYMPERSLDLLITERTIKAALNNVATQNLIDFILKHARKIFAITVLVFLDLTSRSEAMRTLYYHQVTDDVAPIPNLKAIDSATSGISCTRLGALKTRCSQFCEETRLWDCKHERQLAAFHHSIWTSRNFREFLTHQWHFYVQHFDGDVFIYDSIERERVLPLDVNLDQQHERSGNFSNVLQARVLQRYQTVIPLENAWTDKQGIAWVDVGIKTIKQSADYDIYSLWRKEAAAMKAMNSLESNILRGIGAFHQGDKFCLLTEWASGGNLRDFWERNPSPELSHNVIMETLVQLHGLIVALDHIHHGTSLQHPPGSVYVAFEDDNPPTEEQSQDANTNIPSIVVSPDLDEHDTRTGAYISSRPGEINSSYWRHGDIKPENVFVFLESGNSQRIKTLKLGDFGTARRVPMSVGLSYKPEWRTRVYESPDYYTNPTERVSRKADVWSMGCVLFEVVLWLLYGVQGIGQFYSNWQDWQQERSTPYWMSTQRFSGASISSHLQDWIRFILENDPECKNDSGSAIKSLVELIRDKCLVVMFQPGNQAEYIYHVRASADELRQEFADIIFRAQNVVKYCFTGSSRVGVRSPWHSLNRVISSDTSSALAETKLERTSSTYETAILTGEPPALWTFVNLNEYEHPPSDELWITLPDEDFAFHVAQLPEIKSVGLFQTGTTSKLCTDCQELDLENGDLVFRRSVRYLRRESAAGCELCYLLNWADAEGLLDIKLDIDKTIEFYRRESRILIKGNENSWLRLSKNPESRSIIESSKSGSILSGFPQLPDAGTIGHLAIIREWLDDCDRNHPACIPVWNLTNRPMRLVEILEAGEFCRLLDCPDIQTFAGEHPPYVALSYSWGKTGEHLVCRKENFDEFKAGFPTERLPATLRDTARIVLSLGLQYIWIDALCIIFDSKEDWEEQAGIMSDIFGGAYCVIAATSAEASTSGFLQHREQRRFAVVPSLTQVDRSDSIYVSSLVENFKGDVLEAHLHGRAWTLQERALARRTIYFAANQTYFECGNGIRCETLTKLFSEQQVLLGDPNFPQNALRRTKGEAISLMMYLFESYSTMQITVTTDRPFAIAALEQRLAVALDSRSTAGVFEKYKGYFLLWRALDSSLRPIDFSSLRMSVPSWSWMAYWGRIEYFHPPFGQIQWNSEIELSFTRDTTQSWLSMSCQGEPFILEAPSYRFNEPWSGDIYLDCSKEFRSIIDIRTSRYLLEERRCIIIGYLREDFVVNHGKADSESSYWALIVSEQSQSEVAKQSYWRRIGVGRLCRRDIDFHTPPIRIRVE